jgi:hypothetical protein
MTQAFNCRVCGEFVQPGKTHPCRCKHTCGKPECQKIHIKQEIKKHDEQRQRQRIAQRKQSGIDLVTCQVCGKEFEMIHYRHLKTHEMTVSEYKKMYPNAPTLNSRTKQTRGEGAISQSHYLTYSGKEPDSRLLEFLTGALLGDGSLEKRKLRKNARYAEGGNNQAYLEWKHQLMCEYFHCTFFERLSKPDKRTGKRYHGWWLRTSIHPLLTDLHRQWYQPHKVVPMDLINRYLTEFALTVWFCDDGYSGSGIFLYPLSFSHVESQFLQEILYDRFRLSFSLLTNSKNQPLFRLQAGSRYRFREIVGAFDIPGMAYKLEL